MVWNIKFLNGEEKSFESLVGADLSHADLSHADLRYADLRFIKGIISFCIEEHVAIYYRVSCGYRIKIGCCDYDINKWVDDYKNIGKLNNYNLDNIEAYGAFIKLCSNYELV